MISQEEEEGSDAQQAAAPKPPGGKLATALTATGVTAESGGSQEPKKDQTALETSSMGGTGKGGINSVAVVGAKVNLPMMSCLSWGRGGLRSADDLKTPFSNYTSGYKALLDYVWIDPEKIEVAHVYSMWGNMHNVCRV